MNERKFDELQLLAQANAKRLRQKWLDMWLAGREYKQAAPAPEGEPEEEPIEEETIAELA